MSTDVLDKLREASEVQVAVGRHAPRKSLFLVESNGVAMEDLEQVAKYLFGQLFFEPHLAIASNYEQN